MLSTDIACIGAGGDHDTAIDQFFQVRCHNRINMTGVHQFD